MRSPLVFLLLTFGLFPAVGAQAQHTVPMPSPENRAALASTVYWNARAGGFTYRWTGKDLTATNTSTKKPVFSVLQSLKKEFAPRTAGDPAADELDVNDHYEVSFRPLSVAGSLLSYERDDYWDGGAHPSGNERFVTVDVRRPDRRVRLTDLFPAEHIRQALLKDAVVRRVLKRENISPPSTLDGLVKALANKNFGGDDDYMYSFPENFLESFAFHHMENDKVAVRFLMPHGAEIYRFQNTQLAILLPIPERLKSAFAQSSPGNLMQSLRKIKKDRMSSYTPID